MVNGDIVDLTIDYNNELIVLKCFKKLVYYLYIPKKLTKIYV